MRKPCIYISALSICLVFPCGQSATAQEASTGGDLCILEPGAKESLLFERQCLNDGLNEQGRELPLTSANKNKGQRWFERGNMKWKAGLMKDDSDTKLFGFGFVYRLTPSTRLSGQAGYGGAPYSPEGTVTFGFRFDF